MTAGATAILISVVSLVVSIGSFFWNILQKFIFVRPKIRVSFGLYHAQQGGAFIKSLCSLTVTNIGPGPVMLNTCIAKIRLSCWSKVQYALLNPIHGNPLVDDPPEYGPFGGGLPAKLDAGEVKSFYFPFTKDGFLSEPINQVGATDTYGRNNWCSRRDVRKVKVRLDELL